MTEPNLGQAAYLLLSVWAAAVVILMLNHPLYRFLEGYMFPAWLAEWLKRRNRQRLRTCLCEIKTLHDKWAEQDIAFAADDLDRYRTLRRELVKWMP